MRNHTGYGGVVKLGGARRKPFGARFTVGWDAADVTSHVYIEKSIPSLIDAMNKI